MHLNPRQSHPHQQSLLLCLRLLLLRLLPQWPQANRFSLRGRLRLVFGDPCWANRSFPS